MMGPMKVLIVKQKVCEKEKNTSPSLNLPLGKKEWISTAGLEPYRVNDRDNLVRLCFGGDRTVEAMGFWVRTATFWLEVKRAAIAPRRNVRMGEFIIYKQ